MAIEYTVSQLAALAGVTARALRHYDAIGLLKPTRASGAGYRLYGPAEVDRLQLILFYRALGLELSAVAELLKEADLDRAAALTRYLAELERRREQLDRQIAAVKRSIQQEQGGIPMTDVEKFECFKQRVIGENERKYGEELRSKYGDQEVDAAYAKVMGLTKQEYDAWTALGKEIQDRLTQAVRAGLPPEGEEGQAIAQAHRRWLAYSWSAYTPQAHAGLAAMYPEDPRFVAYYDREAQGCAAFLRDAVELYTKRLR